MGPKPARKRNRKRKRRVASDSSSSESDSSSSSSGPNETQPQKPDTPGNADTETDESEDTSSDSDSDPGVQGVDIPKPPPPQRDSPSPPPTVDIPPFILPNTPESEQALRQKFRTFWMASIAEGFKDDLEEIRKEPNLGPSRLSLLIESLASGADVFSSSSGGVAGSVNEMEVVLDQLP